MAKNLGVAGTAADGMSGISGTIGKIPLVAGPTLRPRVSTGVGGGGGGGRKPKVVAPTVTRPRGLGTTGGFAKFRKVRGLGGKGAVTRGLSGR